MYRRTGEFTNVTICQAWMRDLPISISGDFPQLA
jgi:hypothetical protein